MPEDKNKDLSSDEDSLLFRESMRDVKVLAKNERYSFEEKPKPKPIKKNLAVKLNAGHPFIQETNIIQSNDVLFYTRNGVQHKTTKQLKRGRLIIDEKVDLHGLTKQEAHELLLEFLVEQVSLRHRCILIVHGKGTGSLNNRPVLKNLVYNLLKNEPSVLAFASAQQRDGGTGAVYVLLKNI
ncbi:MAG: Smr/MutS family protein [Cycloclasticus sp.]|jgi:DNA-nicking Smr family endonuclease|nr:Smr/MutS family protein [Cycloclasticus sp.]MDF1688766.1 Smr/MutS family protein [Cycloclasticus sp.]MEE4290388.1 Smr/MutS family protein [Cycloclasticus sp.]